jgi:hypothetical protein
LTKAFQIVDCGLPERSKERRFAILSVPFEQMEPFRSPLKGYGAKVASGVFRKAVRPNLGAALVCFVAAL